jgi:hypothetical protein
MENEAEIVKRFDKNFKRYLDLREKRLREIDRDEKAIAKYWEE